MKQSKLIKDAQTHIEEILQKISEGKIVEVTLAKTDEDARTQGWPSADIMNLCIQQLNEALPDSLQKYLKIINLN